MSAPKDRELEKSSLLLFALMMTANAGNYVFQLVAGRGLSVESYGVFNSLNSLTGVLAVVGTAVGAVCCRNVACRAEGEDLSALLGRLLALAAAAAAGLLALAALAAPWAAGLLRLADGRMVLLCAVSGALCALAFVPAGVAQGLRRFVPYGLGGVLGVTAKVAAAALLLLLGWDVWGALLAVTVYYAVYGGSLYLFLRPVLRSGRLARPGGALWRELGGVLLVQLCLSLLTNGDVLLVKALFDETAAGLYASASVIGKIATYVSGAVVVSLFPLAAERQSRGQDPRGLLGKGLLYGAGLALLCAGLLAALGGWLVPLFFGEKYAGAAPLLLPVGFYVVPLSALTVLFNYQMALGRTKRLSFTVLAACAVLTVLAARFGRTVAGVMALTGGVLTAVLLLNLFFALKKEKKP